MGIDEEFSRYLCLLSCLLRFRILFQFFLAFSFAMRCDSLFNCVSACLRINTSRNDKIIII